MQKPKQNAAVSQCPLTLLENFTSVALSTMAEILSQLSGKRMQGMVQPLPRMPGVCLNNLFHVFWHQRQ